MRRRARPAEPFVWITEALEAKHYENTQASFTYTHDSWEEITRERDAEFPDLDIVGWYHTHPDFGIFLSSHDLFIHHNFFAQPLQVAYVVDPIRQTRGVLPVAGRPDGARSAGSTCRRPRPSGWRWPGWPTTWRTSPTPTAEAGLGASPRGWRRS